MNRRSFFKKSAAGIIGFAAADFPNVNIKTRSIKQEVHPFAFDREVPKPSGTMPTGELGTTGIKLSKFGFGSHMRQDIAKYVKEREFMVREALELGITMFDIYDHEQKCYQYEPMGKYLKDVINDVVLSISILSYDNRTLEQEFERDLRAFGREYIDLVRIHSYSSKSKNWEQWETLFKYKEQGKIRAVGIPIHSLKNLEEPLAQLPLDYVIFPFNFYHNWTWLHKGMILDNYDSLIATLKQKKIGTIAMKPLASDWLIYPFKKLASEYDTTGTVNMAKACLRYVINSGMDIDCTIAGMYYPFHVRENVDAFYNSAMSDQERIILKKVRETAKITARNYLPEHYKFLEDWVPEKWDNSDLFA